MTGKNFGYVRPNTSDEQLRKLQKDSTRWLDGEKVEEYVDPYKSPKEGLEEIRTPKPSRP